MCLKGSVASLLYVLFAYEIRYSESCHRFWGNPSSPALPGFMHSYICRYICFFDSILFSVYEFA